MEWRKSFRVLRLSPTPESLPRGASCHRTNCRDNNASGYQIDSGIEHFGPRSSLQFVTGNNNPATPSPHRSSKPQRRSDDLVCLRNSPTDTTSLDTADAEICLSIPTAHL